MVLLYWDVVVVPLGERSWLNRMQQCKRIPIVTTLAGKTKLVEQSGFSRVEDGIISDEAGVCSQYPTGVAPFRKNVCFSHRTGIHHCSVNPGTDIRIGKQ